MQLAVGNRTLAGCCLRLKLLLSNLLKEADILVKDIQANRKQPVA
jgi:hypothetical protein